MSESSLSLEYKELSSEIGWFLGYGRGADFGDSAWDASQTANINSAIKRGQRNFYYPPPVGGDPVSYDWSFLRPAASVVLVDGASVVQLPDDCSGVEGQLTISSTTGQLWWPLDVTGEGYVRTAYTRAPTSTGRPVLAALRPKKDTSRTRGNRVEFYIWPIADADYTINFVYYIRPNALTLDQPFPYGGPEHAETMLESCLAAAEKGQNDNSAVHAQEFETRLMASIGMDRKMKPQKLGYNGDRSDGVSYSPRWRHGWSGGITVDDVQY